jgi:hypothetical protein
MSRFTLPAFLLSLVATTPALAAPPSGAPLGEEPAQNSGKTESPRIPDSWCPYLCTLAADPGGGIAWGPSVSAEIGLSDNVSLSVMYRFLGLGLTTRALAQTVGYGSFDAYSSIAASARGNYYFGDQLSGPHLGFALEYARPVTTTIDLSEDDDHRYANAAHFLVPALHLGYRSPFGRFFLHPSASVNYAIYLGDSSFDIGRDPNSEFDLAGTVPPLLAKNQLLADLRCDIGFYF